MKIFSSPATICALLLAFLLTGLLGGPDCRFDIAVVQWVGGVRHTHPKFTSFVVILTQLGSIYATLGVGLLASAWLAIRNQLRPALLLAATVIIERLTVDGLKLVMGRPRPDFDLSPIVTSSSSFPSGHSANSMAVFVAVAMIAAPIAWRRPALAAAIVLSLLIGMTRIFLGVHWPSDVIGGWTWGLLVVAMALAVGRRSGAIEAQHDVVGRHRSAIGKDEAA